MSDSLLHVVVPYSRFVECQHRRDRIAAELTRRDQPPTIDAEGVPVQAALASAQPLTTKPC